MNPDSVDELLRAMARALTSEDGRDDFHRLAARDEAAVHERLGRRAGDAADHATPARARPRISIPAGLLRRA